MEIRALRPDEFDGVRDIRARAFGPVPDEAWRQRVRRARPTLEAGRNFAGFDGGEIIATGTLYDMTQWWHGRAVSLAGVSAITVAPEQRGRGIGRELMTGLLERAAGFGHPLAVLYPATTTLYRSVGWEHAGAEHHVEIPTEALRTVAADRVSLRRAGPDDAAEVAAVIGRAHRAARDCGPVGWDEPMWRSMLETDEHFCYLAEDGFLAYHWNESATGLEVLRLVASSERTLRALWALVGSGSSTAETVRACVAPYDPVLWLLRERETEYVHRSQWMLRLVDAPAAIEARGYPSGVTAGASLLIEDPQLPANSGHWRLEIKDGEGRLERTAENAGAVRLGPRGLAALYAGVPVATLRRTGLLQGGDADALSPAFAATPFTLDYF
ncbi:GNAT family N-acetyltransferase [Actinomadura sp. KC06]|uniref:GNAT family N-acetyltransferase n=1 Tax=Actinomadura sp. KC06 TaxID=2530369 RepID=UPI0010441445|nr:GNAT family N-acetyltransferase [Actinomadura sp. KC06]TDD38895.1 GNAT family N-acetyltransferase [Actinomadura sp. KC06]